MSNQDTANKNAANAQSAAQDVKDDATRAGKSVVDAGKAQYAAAKDKLGDGVDAAKSYASDIASQAQDKLHDGVDVAKGYAYDAAYAARDKATDTLDTLEDRIRENPLAALAVAAGVGVVVGMWLRGR